MHRSHQGWVFDFGELTDPGLHPDKQVNEDLAGSRDTAHGSLFIVCDGMGGHAGGQLASQTAVATVCDQVENAPAEANPRQVLESSIHTAAKAVYDVGGDTAQLRPGSTLVAILVHAGGAEVAHVGDSRAYLLRYGTLTPLTKDHSVVRVLVERGDITEEEAVDHPDANQITRALGMAPTVEVELRPTPASLMAGDVVILCTDGLTDLVTDDEIGMLAENHLKAGPEKAATQLVEVAKMRGGYDNITVQVIRIEEVPEEKAEAPAPAPAAPSPAPPSAAAPGQPPPPRRPPPPSASAEPSPPAPPAAAAPGGPPPPKRPPPPSAMAGGAPSPPAPAASPAAATEPEAASPPPAPAAVTEPEAASPPPPAPAPAPAPVRPAAFDQLNLPAPTIPQPNQASPVMIIVTILALIAGVAILFAIVGGGSKDD